MYCTATGDNGEAPNPPKLCQIVATAVACPQLCAMVIEPPPFSILAQEQRIYCKLTRSLTAP